MYLRAWVVATLAVMTIAVGAQGAMAAELVDDSVSFTVPGVGVPSLVCVTINGEKTCNPSPATSPITATVSAFLAEGNSLTITEGAPATQASGENCARLAKTVNAVLGVGGQVNVQVVGTTPGINQTITGPSVPGELVNNSIELCVNG